MKNAKAWQFLHKIHKYEMSLKSVQSFSTCYIHTETDRQAEFYMHSAGDQKPRRQHLYHTSCPTCICQVQFLSLHSDSLLLRRDTVSQSKWILLSCKMSDCDCPVTRHYIAEHHSQYSQFFTSLHKLTRKHQNAKGNTTTLQWI